MLFLIGQAIMKLDTQKLQYLCFVTFGNASAFGNELDKSASIPSPYGKCMVFYRSLKFCF